MILELDVGNTRCKWRLRNRHELVLQGAFFTVASFDSLADSLSIYRGIIAKVWVVSVVGSELKQKLFEWSHVYLTVTPQFALSSQYCAGVINGYLEPKLLGADRWVGIIGAYNRFLCSCVLVSFGTAVTLDLVLKNGKHLGGFIAPGLNLMLDSLAQKTHQVVTDRSQELFGLRPGVTTTVAVYAAATAMLVGLIDNGLKQLNDADPQGRVEVIFTGGDSHKLLSFYPQAKHIPDLILDGLAYVLDESSDLR